MKYLIILVALFFCSNSIFSQNFRLGNLSILLPIEKKWNAVQHLKDSISESIILLPNNEDVKNWNSAIQMSYSCKRITKSIKSIYVEFDKASKIEGPKSKFTLIEADTISSLKRSIFKIETPSFINDPNPESQLYYLLKTRECMYVIFVAIKSPRLSDEFVDRWKIIFESSKLITN